MFGGEIFIEAKIYEIETNARIARSERHNRGIPDAERMPSGGGVIHEVFRRITNSR